MKIILKYRVEGVYKDKEKTSAFAFSKKHLDFAVSTLINNPEIEVITIYKLGYASKMDIDCYNL